MRSVATIAIVLCLVGCSQETTLVVTVDGDLEPGVEVDELSLSTWLEGAQIWAESRPLGGRDELPMTFRVAATSREELIVELAVEATRGGREVVEARRPVSFVAGEAVPVAVCLWRRCAGDVGGPGCAEGRCEPVGADGDGDADAGPGDAEPDGSAGSDARSDADAEAGGDGGADDGTICEDSCFFMARDGICSDTGPLSSLALCPFGTDCADCGVRYREDCVPWDCSERECGSDGCFGTCGPGCGPTERCMFGGQCIEWVRIEPATFLMGSPEGDPGRQDDETQHEVRLSFAYEVTAFEVTQRWISGIVGSNTSARRACGLDCPGCSYSWDEAAMVANILSATEGLLPCYDCSAGSSCTGPFGVVSPYDCEGYRLPTEAEWEHAARGGTTTATYNGDLDEDHLACESPYDVLDPIAWYCGNSEVTWEALDDCSERGGPASCGPQPVGLLEPNGFGLYDMLGNVSEWVFDWYGPYPTALAVNPFGPSSGERRIVRGGSYVDSGKAQRASIRRRAPQGDEWANFGFRLARTLR